MNMLTSGAGGGGEPWSQVLTVCQSARVLLPKMGEDSEIVG